MSDYVEMPVLISPIAAAAQPDPCELPWYCTTWGSMATFWMPSTWQECREAEDVRKACRAGYYSKPPQPKAPGVPAEALKPGGVKADGKVEAEAKVHQVIVDSWAAGQQQRLDFFRRTGLTPPDEPKPGINPWAVALLAIGGLVLVKELT